LRAVNGNTEQAVKTVILLARMLVIVVETTGGPKGLIVCKRVPAMPINQQQVIILALHDRLQFLHIKIYQ